MIRGVLLRLELVNYGKSIENKVDRDPRKIISLTLFQDRTQTSS